MFRSRYEKRGMSRNQVTVSVMYHRQNLNELLHHTALECHLAAMWVCMSLRLTLQSKHWSLEDSKSSNVLN